MSQPFIGEIRAFGFSFPPKGWALCSGQLLSINQNQALFALLGTQYGGNGVQTFALPDLRGRAGLSYGQGPGTSNYTIGQQSGVENVTVLTTQMPTHTHTWTATSAIGDAPSPAGNILAGAAYLNGTAVPTYAAAGGATVPLASDTLGLAGSGQPHNNLQPFLVMNYAIAIQGIFPSRN